MVEVRGRLDVKEEIFALCSMSISVVSVFAKFYTRFYTRFSDFCAAAEHNKPLGSYYPNVAFCLWLAHPYRKVTKNLLRLTLHNKFLVQLQSVQACFQTLQLALVCLNNSLASCHSPFQSACHIDAYSRPLRQGPRCSNFSPL